MNRHSQIVIGPDGTVLAATGQLPAGLVDVRLENCDGLPRELRDAGRALLRRLRDSGDRVVTEEFTVGGDGHGVQLVAIEALAIRRGAVDLRALLAAKLAVLSAQAFATHVTLTVTIADDVPAVVRMDSEKIAWVVTTLVGNALRYVKSGSHRPPGGAITVRATYDAASAAVAIEVQDDGPGIPAASVARLFKRDGLNVLGSGLALLLMADVCAAHGGRIDRAQPHGCLEPWHDGSPDVSVGVEEGWDGAAGQPEEVRAAHRRATAAARRLGRASSRSSSAASPAWRRGPRTSSTASWRCSPRASSASSTRASWSPRRAA